MSWGRGGMVGVRAAIWRHEQAQQQAIAILRQEHGIRHKPGERLLCPLCERTRNENRKKEAADGERGGADVQEPRGPGPL